MSRVKRGEARVHRLARVLPRQAVAGGRVPHRSESRALVGRLASIAMRGPQSVRDPYRARFSQSVRQSVRDPYRARLPQSVRQSVRHLYRVRFPQSVRDPYRLPTRPPSVSQLGDPRGQRFPIGAEI